MPWSAFPLCVGTTLTWTLGCLHINACFCIYFFILGIYPEVGLLHHTRLAVLGVMLGEWERLLGPEARRSFLSAG